MSGVLKRVLMTGGSGRLGTELGGLIPGLAVPLMDELNVTQPQTIQAAIDKYCPRILLHAAAYTDVAGAEQDREGCWEVNVTGTANIVQAAVSNSLFLVHISTDYVFEGTKGAYKEQDVLGPVCNYYSLSKLVAEQMVQFCPEHLVIRTSFREKQWPYPQGFTDVYTSQDYVDIIAPDIALAILHCEDIPYDTIHIATERKSAYELAKRRRPDVTPASKQQIDVDLPDDISLDISRWQELKEKWNQSR